MKRGAEYPQLVLARQALVRALHKIDERRLEALDDVTRAHDYLDAIVTHLDPNGQVVDEYIAVYERLACNLQSGIDLYTDDPRALGCAAGLVLCEIEDTFRALARMERQGA